MNTNENHTTLKIVAFDCSPEEITQKLDLTPTKTAIKGQEYLVGPKDKKITKTYKTNYWEYRITKIENKWIGDQIEYFIEKIIRPRQEKLKNIIETCEAEFSIVQYYYTGCNPGFNHQNKIIKTLGYIGADLDIDIYCLEEDET